MSPPSCPHDPSNSKLRPLAPRRIGCWVEADREEFGVDSFGHCLAVLVLSIARNGDGCAAVTGQRWRPSAVTPGMVDGDGEGCPEHHRRVHQLRFPAVHCENQGRAVVDGDPGDCAW